jgi:hypothetical protein
MRMPRRGSTRQPLFRLGALGTPALLCAILPLAGCMGLFNEPFDADPFYAAKDNPRNEPGTYFPGIKEAGLHSEADVTGDYATSALCLKEWVVRANPFEVAPEVTAESLYPEASLRDYVTAYPQWGNPLLLTDHYYFVAHTAPGAAIFLAELRQAAPDRVHADIYAGTKYTKTPESIAATVVDGLKHCESAPSAVVAATGPGYLDGTAPQNSGSLAGTYDISGTDPDGRKYNGVARVRYIAGKVYDFEWNEGDRTTYRYGILYDDRIDVVANVLSYELTVHPDGTLTSTQGADGNGSEVLTPRRPTN